MKTLTKLQAINRACQIIETADQRLLAMDGPIGNSPPDMSLTEWRELYMVLDRARMTAKNSVRRSA